MQQWKMPVVRRNRLFLRLVGVLWSMMIPRILLREKRERRTEGGHGSASEYVLALLDEAQKKRAWEKAEKLVLDGAKSPKRPMTDEDWQQLHANVRQTPTTDKP